MNMLHIPFPALTGALILVITAVGIIAIIAFKLGRKTGIHISEKSFEAEIGKRIVNEREDAVKRSRAVLGGQLSEQLAPYLPAFPANPTEVRFIGKPIDFIAFSGSSSGEISEILFIEVKTGTSSLSKSEKEVKKAVEQGRVRYIEYRI